MQGIHKSPVLQVVQWLMVGYIYCHCNCKMLMAIKKGPSSRFQEVQIFWSYNTQVQSPHFLWITMFCFFLSPLSFSNLEPASGTSTPVLVQQQQWRPGIIVIVVYLIRIKITDVRGGAENRKLGECCADLNFNGDPLELSSRNLAEETGKVRSCFW